MDEDNPIAELKTLLQDFASQLENLKAENAELRAECAVLKQLISENEMALLEARTPSREDHKAAEFEKEIAELEAELAEVIEQRDKLLVKVEEQRLDIAEFSKQLRMARSEATLGLDLRHLIRQFRQELE